MSEEVSKAIDIYNVILRAHVTEKATHLVERQNKYTFLVSKSATKIEIRSAVEQMWNVRVVAVKTVNRVGKPRRYKARETNKPDTKKAIVVLHPEDRIAFF